MSRPDKPRHRSGGFSFTPEMRTRTVEGMEVRDGKAGTDSIVLTGSPIVYDQPYTVRDSLGEFSETMSPGVVSDIIDTCDCRYLINHDGMPLARTVSGTLKLIDTPTSLRYEAHLDARSQLANDLAVAVERGDVSQMSCGFIVAADTWEDDWTVRTVEKFGQLLDISAVTYPASPTTSVELQQRAFFESVEQAFPESRARLEKYMLIAEELRAGKAISSKNAALLANFVAAHKNVADAVKGAGPHAAAVAALVGGAGGEHAQTPVTGGKQDGSSTGGFPSQVSGSTAGDASGSRSFWTGPSLITR